MGEKIEARNALENYVYSMKNTLGDSEKGVADKIGDDDKDTIEKALEEVNEWLDDNQDAEKEDFEEKLKEVQDTCSPIISKVYQESGRPGRRRRLWRRRRPRRPRRALSSPLAAAAAPAAPLVG